MPRKNTEANAQQNTSLPASFEQAMNELGELVAQMESGSLPLEQSLQAYQRGAELIRFCAGKLDAVEQQVKVLEAGMLKPFTPESKEDTA